jgi:hypothetical protein
MSNMVSLWAVSVSNYDFEQTIAILLVDEFTTVMFNPDIQFTHEYIISASGLQPAQLKLVNHPRCGAWELSLCICDTFDCSKTEDGVLVDDSEGQ